MKFKNPYVECISENPFLSEVGIYVFRVIPKFSRNRESSIWIFKGKMKKEIFQRVNLPWWKISGKIKKGTFILFEFGSQNHLEGLKIVEILNKSKKFSLKCWDFQILQAL